MAHIKLEAITKEYGAATALRDMSLEIEDGEFFVLLGPTGAGKTTTLRLIAGLEKPTGGTVSIGGEDVRNWSAAERDVALVFQYYSLYPRYTVRQNLAFPLKSRIRSYSSTEIEERVLRAARTLRIEHLLERKTDKLSGGEMQRVSIGRAIVREPKVFLMDEPLSNLDAKLREALRAELKDLQMKLGATFLFVTHDQIEAMSMGDKVGILNAGRIVQVGTPQEIYNEPRNVFVAGFVGSPAMNLLDGEITSGKASALAGKLEIPLEEASRLSSSGGRKVVLGIRSEDVRVGPAEVTEARVHDVENHGVEKIVTLRVDEHLFRATMPANAAVEVESTVRFSWNPKKLHCFDKATGTNILHSA
jgi:multiple sugar transport system ATP-binding protein